MTESPSSAASNLTRGRGPKLVLVTAIALLVTAIVLCALAATGRTASRDPFAACATVPAAQVIKCENALPGNPQSDWQTNGSGDTKTAAAGGTDYIEGFATSMSVDVGQTESFKINTPSTRYELDIYRLGYYGGDGSRLIDTINVNVNVGSARQAQPPCLVDGTSGLIDCGNWSVSASWQVPSDAVSGVYIAHLVQDDQPNPKNGFDVPFVVRNDASQSDVLVQTSDATWEAYNPYGGNSLYQCNVACPPGHPQGYKGAFAVSYNRPFETATRTYLWSAEYPMIRFLEANGYDVGYISENQVASNGSLLLDHKVFLSSGHDEYWSQDQVNAVTNARDHGVNLAFFSGNDLFWHTIWGNSEDGANTPYRTLISYKETHFNAVVDPNTSDPWTGTWADPRFQASPLAANALTGQFPQVADGGPENGTLKGGSGSITVSGQFARLRFWRNTAVAQLGPDQSLVLAPGTPTIGYEWDVDADNGFRPAGEFDMSAQPLSNLDTFTDFGTNTTPGTGNATYSLTLYRAPGGALVFGAGTMQWAWGLDADNPGNYQPDVNMQQATVNLLGDMGATPQTLLPGLVPATPSTDHTPPTSRITSPAAGSSVASGTPVTITGSAADSGGGVVAGVEVSTDGGHTWHPAQGTTNWSYTWTADRTPSATIESRAVDDSGNLETPSVAATISVTCPCGLWGQTVPSQTDSGDNRAVEVGMKFTSDVTGYVDGVRFYKSAANTGPHIGDLWTAQGTLLARATFTNESASGWQDVQFDKPVAIQAGTVYVVSTFDPAGHYADTPLWFYPKPSPPPVGAWNDAPPLHAVPAVNGATNGMYAYATTPHFPTSTSSSTNYWVDVDFTPDPNAVISTGGVVAGGGASSASTTQDHSRARPALALRITTFTQTSTAWRRTPGKRHTPHALRAVGSSFRIAVSRDASVSLVFTRQVTGVRKDGRCVAVHGHPTHARRCLRPVPAGTLALGTMTAGPHWVAFTGRLSKRSRLAPGTYTVLAEAKVAGSPTARSGPLTFKIIG